MLTLAEVKQDLRVIHDSDDNLLSDLLSAAESEVMAFMNLDYVPDTPDVGSAIKLLVRGMYDEADPTKLEYYRRAAESKMFPYRAGIGV